MSHVGKGKRGEPSRAYAAKKRKFQGNQFVEKSGEDKIEEHADSNASAKKIKRKTGDEVSYNPLIAYRIIEFFTVFIALSEILVCYKCKNPVKFKQTGFRGFGFKIIVVCRCSGRSTINSGPFVGTGYEINRKIGLVMRLLGIAREGIDLFANLMDICDGLSQQSYDNILVHLHLATKAVFDFCSLNFEVLNGCPP